MTSTSTLLQNILAATLTSLSVSFMVALALVLTRRWHIRFTGDSQLNLPQKIHSNNIPRVGGLAVVAGFIAGLVQLVWFGGVPPAVSPSTAFVLLMGLVPIVIIGFGEDITKQVSPKVRLLWIVLGSMILLRFRDLALESIGVPMLDPLFSSWGVALAFSVFACVGASNAYNLIDGLNGLLAGVALITLAAIAWVAATLGDQKVFALAVLLAVATIGWLPFNWPRPRLFAGDGGAYALGFLTSAILLLLIQRHTQVSAWFALTAMALPVWETFYTIWRRSRTQVKAMEPDQSHLHQLVRARMHTSLISMAMRRAQRMTLDGPATQPHQMSSMIKAPNSACSPVLWLLHAGAVVAGAINYESTAAQAVIMVVFAVFYVQLHRALMRSREKQRQLAAALAAALAAE